MKRNLPSVDIIVAITLTIALVSSAEETPESLPGAETFFYREGEPQSMRLFVVKPTGWQVSDKRPALVWFFGGGWTKGTPARSVGPARWAAKLGMVGIAPDYRTKNRFDTSPLESVADGRAALRWVQEHAEELGIDPARVVVGGGSAGGHLALWTGIEATPPGSSKGEAPLRKPLALILSSPASDTSRLKGYTPIRFGEHAEDLSPLHQLDAKMPPILLFHGDADAIVPYRQSVALTEKLMEAGNDCEFVTVPEGTHNFASDTPGWRQKQQEMIEAFLRELKVVSDS